MEFDLVRIVLKIMETVIVESIGEDTMVAKVMSALGEECTDIVKDKIENWLKIGKVFDMKKKIESMEFLTSDEKKKVFDFIKRFLELSNNVEFWADHDGNPEKGVESIMDQFDKLIKSEENKDILELVGDKYESIKSVFEQWAESICKELKEDDLIISKINTLHKTIEKNSEDIIQHVDKRFDQVMGTIENRESNSVSSKETKTVNICTYTFARDRSKPTDILLDLTESFNEGKFIKNDISWEQIKKEIDVFVKREMKDGPYQVAVSAPYSIAFLVGRTIKGVRCKAMPVQTMGNGVVRIWNPEEQMSEEVSSLDIRVHKEDSNTSEVVLAIGIRDDIVEEVSEYVSEHLLAKEIITCSLPETGPDVVKNGAHAWELAKNIDNVIRKIGKQYVKIHLFFAGPYAVIYHLGYLSNAYGKVLIYEYDMKNKKYFPGVDC